MKIPEGFSIVFDDSVVVLDRNNIYYYDMSVHLIYLIREDTALLSFPNGGKFTVYADKKKIYDGMLLSPAASFIPDGPVILSYSFYPDFTLKIDFGYRLDSLGNPVNEDPRSDPRIINTLKKYNQFHEGIVCKIDTAFKNRDGKIGFTYSITNNDSFNYYILSYDKMGLGLFHYFTNGLGILVPGQTLRLPRISMVEPEPWNSWNKEWLDRIPSGMTKNYTIIYDEFDTVPAGFYNAYFEFPGLGHQIGKVEVVQDNGRLWLGNLRVSGKIRIPWFK